LKRFMSRIMASYKPPTTHKESFIDFPLFAGFCSTDGHFVLISGESYLI